MRHLDGLFEAFSLWLEFRKHRIDESIISLQLFLNFVSCLIDLLPLHFLLIWLQLLSLTREYPALKVIPLGIQVRILALHVETEYA